MIYSYFYWDLKTRVEAVLKCSMSSMKILKLEEMLSLRGFKILMYDSLRLSSVMAIRWLLVLPSTTSKTKQSFILPNTKLSIVTPKAQNFSSIFSLRSWQTFARSLLSSLNAPATFCSACLIMLEMKWCTCTQVFSEVQYSGTASVQWFSAHPNIYFVQFVMCSWIYSLDSVSFGQISSQMKQNSISNYFHSSSFISGIYELETSVNSFLPFSATTRPRLDFFSLLKQASPNLSFHECRYILRTDTWSSVIMSSFLVMFLRMLLCSLFLLNCACRAFSVDRMVSTLSMDSLQMGAINGSSLRVTRVLQQASQEVIDLAKRPSTSLGSLVSLIDLQNLMSCCRMLGNSQRFFSFSRSLLIVSSFWISFRFTEKVESILRASSEILSMERSSTLSLSSTAQMLSFISLTVSMLLMNLLQFSNTSDCISWSWVLISSSISLLRRISSLIEFCLSMPSTQRLASKLELSMSIKQCYRIQSIPSIQIHQIDQLQQQMIKPQREQHLTMFVVYGSLSLTIRKQINSFYKR